MGWFKIKARTNLGPQNYMYLSAPVHVVTSVSCLRMVSCLHVVRCLRIDFTSSRRFHVFVLFSDLRVALVSNGQRQHALQHCQNSFRSHCFFTIKEIRDIFRRYLTKAEKEVKRRYQASDASLNILEDFSRVSDWALTRRLERPSKKYQHDYVQSFPIVKREVNRIRKILVWETRPRTTLHNKWKTIARRSIPKEIFANVERYLVDSELVDDVSRTDRRITLTVHKDMEEFFPEFF